jgi:hypothetical protein
VGGRHPSVVALLQASAEKDPAEAIRARARELISYARTLGWDGPPFSMSELASLCGLKVDEQADLKDDQDACVMPGHVLLNRRKPSARRRYSLAHEITHTLFPDYEKEVRRVGKLWRRDGDDSELERLCQVGAAELLFPFETFVAAVAQDGLSLSTTLALAARFEASPEAAARRVVETSDTVVMAALLRPFDAETNDWYAFKPSDQHFAYADLRVATAWSSPSATATIPIRAAPPKQGSAVRAWRQAVVANRRGRIQTVDQESWNIVGAGSAWRSESVTLPASGSLPREVMCMLMPAAAARP